MNQRIYRFFRIQSYIWMVFYLWWNRFYFQLVGIKYGRNLRVYNKILVTGCGEIIIGDDFTFTSGGSYNPICRNKRGAIRLGTSHAKIEIGNNVGGSSVCLWARERITIGNNVNIGGDVIIMDHDAHSHNYIERRKGHAPLNGKYKIIPTAPVVVEDDVWIGARSIILKGVHIGARSIIAAGSVVVKDIPSDVVAGGNPCKIIRKLK